MSRYCDWESPNSKLGDMPPCQHIWSPSWLSARHRRSIDASESPACSACPCTSRLLSSLPTSISGRTSLSNVSNVPRVSFGVCPHPGETTGRIRAQIGFLRPSTAAANPYRCPCPYDRCLKPLTVISPAALLRFPPMSQGASLTGPRIDLMSCGSVRSSGLRLPGAWGSCT